MATPTNLPASATSGQVLTAQYLNNLRGAFRILQVVQGTYNITIANSTTTMAETGLQATITPQSTSSLVLVIVQQSFSKSSGNVNNAVQSQIVRGSTPIHVFQGASLYTGTATESVGASACGIILDSPATTSATIYKTQFANFTAAASVGANPNGAIATITLMEISA
jgi:hypothetical protein